MTARHGHLYQPRFQDAAIAAACEEAHKGEGPPPQPKPAARMTAQKTHHEGQQRIVPRQRAVEVENGDPAARCDVRCCHF
jgi:hypothetical protein